VLRSLTQSTQDFDSQSGRTASTLQLADAITAEAWSASSLLDSEIVFHREDTGDSVGLNIRNVLVSFVRDDSLKSYVATFHDDMNGWHRTNTVTLQCRVTVDGTITATRDGRRWEIAAGLRCFFLPFTPPYS
jgi:hypothetical protein